MKAILFSNNCIGDNLFMSGALRFLLQFYSNIFFLCKQKNYANVKLFFTDNPGIICVPFDEKNEYSEIYTYISTNYENNDIFICGEFHKCYLQSKITNPLFLNHVPLPEKYTIDHDTLTTQNYAFISGFYRDIGLNLNYFYEYFDLPVTDRSLELYQLVQEYDIIFIQLSSSNGKSLNISELKERYLDDINTILICNDVNVYNIETNRQKFELSNLFIYQPIVYYKDVIQHAKEIYIIDSCFTGIILPYLKTHRLKASKVRIILRDEVSTCIY